ncbi:sigma-70 family RNA polymerase sigma factor [Bacillus pfraonensis]|uniref:sigma-70 family RNA polymerase sigma factor n=1 Tax=Bacillus pfraonensis TaxID=2830844 RepID=UPI003D6E65F0
MNSEVEDIKTMDDEEFMNKYEKLVHYYVHKSFAGRAKSVEHETNLDMDDLVQCGMMGLVKARNGFEPELGFKFSTYAVPRILGEVKRWIRDLQKIKVSREVYRTKGNIAVKQLEGEGVEKIASVLDVSEETAKLALDFDSKTTSIHQVIYRSGEGEDITLESMLMDETSEDEQEDVNNKIVLQSFLNTLDSREYIIWDLHSKNIKQRDIGKELKTSQAQICRVLKRINKKAEAYGEKKMLQAI